MLEGRIDKSSIIVPQVRVDRPQNAVTNRKVRGSSRVMSMTGVDEPPSVVSNGNVDGLSFVVWR